MSKAILFDLTKCTACRGCQVACKQWNEHKAEETSNWGSYENPKELSAETWLKMRFIETERNGKFDWLFLRRACLHCEEASCAVVCPVGAIFKTEDGFVHIDQEWCIGCGTCTQACPFHVPHIDHHAGLAMKCSACTSVGYNRLDEGLKPACVSTCPTGALAFGDRDELVSAGRAQVDKLKANGYPNAYLYGENELGGLHVMYVLDDSPSAVYGLPDDPKVATADVVGKWLSGLVTAGVLTALPFWLVFKRKQELAGGSGKKGGA